MRLSDLKNDECGIIIRIKGHGAFRRRIAEMGFVRGKKVTVIKNAPLKDPIEYNLLGYNVSLRRTEASMIEVTGPEDTENGLEKSYNGVLSDGLLRTTIREKGKTINVALVGNPNSGKTTIFNHASNSRERVGNYSGVTVDIKTATFRHQGYVFNITDLPGTYSLSAYSPEEIYVRDYIINFVPDVVINIVDAANLERNLYLTTQLIDLDVEVIVALNMYDDLQKRNDEFDHHMLGAMIGIPFVPTIGSKGKGVRELFEKIIDVYNDNDPSIRHTHINYGTEIEESILRIQEKLKFETKYTLADKISTRFLAIKLLERDKHIQDFLAKKSNYHTILKVTEGEIERLEQEYNSDSETIITDAKYGFISGALRETYSPNKVTKREVSAVLDSFLTHKLWGFPIFFLFMWIMFTATFRFGQYPMDWLDAGILKLGALINRFMAEGSFKDLLADGIIGGVGGVVVFLPNILILFFFISVMEDTGYMARVAFIMDKVMHKIGLHGKSFIPLIMGFGCNVPAIMATRTIENRNNRLLTMLITPFMSCSARLPVYILIIGAFFPDHKTTLLFFIYILGIAMAIIAALLLKKFFFTSDEQPFVMELPPYRIPTLRSIVRHMWGKGFQYLQKMGGVILVASVIIWALGYFPRNSPQTGHNETNSITAAGESENIVRYNSGISGQGLLTEKNLKTHKQKQITRAEHQENSYIGRLGRFIEPAIRPLGFDWKIGVSLLSGIAAKEVVVSTMGVMYHVDDPSTNNDETLSDKLKNSRYLSGRKTGQHVYTPLVALSLLLFVLIYFPCIAVVAAVNRESGSWKWALFTVFYSTGLAWLVSLIVFQTGSFFFN